MHRSVKITVWTAEAVIGGMIIAIIAVGAHNKTSAPPPGIVDPVSAPNAALVAPDQPTPTDNCGEPGVTCATAPLTTKNPVVAPETTTQVPDTVIYTITTSGHTRLNSVTYLIPGTFQEAQDTSITSPWSKTFTLGDSEFGSSGSLIAQNDGSGSITCTITEDGQTVTTNTSTGPYAVVTCEGG